MSLLYGRGVREHREESPSSVGQGCLITSGEGDFKDSATEINRNDFFAQAEVVVRVERRGKGSPTSR